MNIALHSLKEKVTVDSTEDVPISELETPPVITFCPQQEVDLDTLNEWGYFKVRNLLTGTFDSELLHYYNTEPLMSDNGKRKYK